MIKTLTTHQLLEIQSPEGIPVPAGSRHQVMVICNRCHATGEELQVSVSGRSFARCPNCNGTGYMNAIINVKFEPVINKNF